MKKLQSGAALANKLRFFIQTLCTILRTIWSYGVSWGMQKLSHVNTRNDDGIEAPIGEVVDFRAGVAQLVRCNLFQFASRVDICEYVHM